MLSRKAEGRRQEAEGNAASRPEACDQREQGFKTPPSTRRLQLGRGFRPRPNCSFCLLPSASCLLQFLRSFYSFQKTDFEFSSLLAVNLNRGVNLLD
jgi:hypothetical protein